ncbi:MAG: mechanosensitive ion channel [Oscillatoriophycideae cyanobacterium NC_groundwater_1537_Pr4_S-0.65um_50_18]|nr:mechanosensitive ion channel [Oscillatoriophycideae cyanobacterium NC_groundwater_1537_Pr4_S-0.65um_50_18]
MDQFWCSPVRILWQPPISKIFQLAQVDPTPGQPGSIQLVQPGFLTQLGTYLPSILGAIALLILGWLIALVVASVVKGILNRTSIDNRIANWMTGRPAGDDSPPIEKWISLLVFWVIMAFAIVAFLNALRLEAVSAPLNRFLEQIFSYLPKLGSAALLLGVALLLATLSKTILTRGLARFNLDDRLASQTGESSPFLLNETLGNALYWFILLFFLPLILDVLELQGPLAPVQNLLDQVLSALPKILTAVIIGAVGWLIARVVRGIVTNLLAAVGTDQLGRRVGLTRSAGGMSLSGLLGTIVYVLVLIPTAIAALNALEVQAISAPATRMLEQILTTLPQIFTAALILVLFYVIGRFVADLVASILTSIGFDNIFGWLGLPSIAPVVTPPFPEDILAEEDVTSRRAITPPLPSRTPSEIAGIVVLVGIILFGAVAATEVIGLPVLTAIVNGILAVAARVLVGVIIFGVGLYLANLAFQLITASGNNQAQILGQTARIAIIALVTAMALQQMGIASSIVNLAFGLLLGAIAVAIALAFGLGGRDVAGEQVREWLNSFKGRGR